MMTSEKSSKTMTEMEIEANKDLKLEYDQIMVRSTTAHSAVLVLSMPQSFQMCHPLFFPLPNPLSGVR